MSNPRIARLRSIASLNHVDSSHVPEDQEHQHPPTSSDPSFPSEERTAEAHTHDIERAALKEKHLPYDPPETRKWPDDIVTFDSKADPANARNWPFRKKAVATFLYGTTTMCSTFASSVFASGFQYIAQDFGPGVSKEVVILGLSLFVLGYVPGPIIFAPLSEMYGRKVSVVVPMAIFICLSAATATAKDLQTIFITRFFAGVVASAPVSNVGGGLADMYDQKERGTAVVFYSLMVVSGPTLGPVIGGAVSQSFLGWRWTEYLIVILTSTVVALDLLILPETYAGAILTRKARALRLKTGRWALHSKLEMNDFTLRGFLEQNLQRPLRMLHEPMIFAITLYNSFAFGILYLLFSAVPIVFEENRGWNTVQGSLPFLAVMLGNFLAAGFNVWYSIYIFAPHMERNGGRAEPEKRLPPMMIGGITFPIGFFLLGWTSDPSIHWFPSIIGLMFIGMSFLLIFQAGLNYLIDGYTKFSASAIAANTFMRSFVAAALPLVAPPLFHNLGINWACTLLGCVSILLSAIPYFFYVFGAKWRGTSPFSDDEFR